MPFTGVLTLLLLEFGFGDGRILGRHHG